MSYSVEQRNISVSSSPKENKYKLDFTKTIAGHSNEIFFANIHKYKKKYLLE